MKHKQSLTVLRDPADDLLFSSNDPFLPLVFPLHFFSVTTLVLGFDCPPFINKYTIFYFIHLMTPPPPPPQKKLKNKQQKTKTPPPQSTHTQMLNIQ